MLFVTAVGRRLSRRALAPTAVNDVLQVTNFVVIAGESYESHRKTHLPLVLF